VAFHQPVLPSRFKILRRIGEGGMGMVYETMDVERGVRVALKTVIHHDADALARFKHEFRSLQDIHHPNLVGLGELVADEDDVFFTMELVEGTDLLTYVRGDARRVDGSGSQTVVDARRAADMTFIDPPRDVTIEESDATPHDRPMLSLASDATAFDEVRLRDAFRQIALGLSALHEANKVHRDIKPSNVRVTPEGRVVLLDFGLVLDTEDRHDTEMSMMAGTPAYMAPEQISSHGVGPEADWYAMGVMMYQCLTGRRPFEGTTMDVMAAKLVRDPPPPSALISGVPRDLDALCAHLLSVDKRDRPLAREVLERLDVNVPVASGASLTQSGSNPFVGRARELVELARGFADVVAGRAVTIAVEGESGVGKSCLVKRFVEEVLPAQGQDVLVLTGRCYEREAVPYKAFDEVIDTLSRRLARMEKDELVPLLPDHLEDLAVLFPALLRAPLIAQQAKGQRLDPHERRRHAFDAARDLFGRLARRHRLVLSIDDLQWTDADSLQLLGDLLAPPGAPPMLLIATVRNASEAPGAPPSVLASLPGDVRIVSIDRLASDDARELASRLLQRVAAGGADAAAIAKEAGGHPLFIDELVRHLALTSGEHPVATLRLDDALAARVDRLDESARRVLEIACVIGAPISQETVAHAAALDMREFVRVVALLRTSNLVRTSGARVNDAMQPYHDRVREALVARMDPATARDCHEHIASALEVSKAFDPEVLASHWAGAGHPAKAAKYAVVAAEQAASALAFDRAARLYDWAIVLLPEGDPRRNALRRQLGDALSSAGKGSRAAAEYEHAASFANPADAIDLRRRAASQLLRTGEMARGIAVSRTVLEAVGMRLPQTTLGAVVALLWYRLVLRLRGFGFTPRDESRIAPKDILRLDACASVADTLAYADALRGAVFHTRHLLLALRLGETRRVARALGAECAYLGARGSKTWPRTQRVIALAHEIGERAGTAEARASVMAFTGPAYVVNMRYTTGIDQIERAIVIFREQVPGSVWEVTMLRFFLFMAFAYLSRFAEQRAQQEAALKDALERGDNYAAVMFRIGVLNRIWWMAGDPARARRELDAAVRGWPAGTGAFDMIHFHQLIGYGYIELYEGSGAAAYARVKASWPTLRRSLLLHLEPIRLEVFALRARAALAAAQDPKCPNREAVLRDAERSVRKLEGLDVPMIRWVVRSIHVGLASLRNRPDEVTRLLEHIVKDDAEEAWGAQVLSRWMLGMMRGDIEGDAQCRAAKAALVARGLTPDPRLFHVQFSGLDFAALAKSLPASV
jgi:serine/threonine protein kinase/tetratricopeptide (TPR) repeat protein